MANTLLLIGTILGCITTVLALKCYNCTSILEPNCGITWDFEDTAGDKYLVECPETSYSCDKIVGDFQGSGDQHVYRTCFNESASLILTSDITNVCGDEDVRGGMYCRCNSDGCNEAVRHTGLTWLLTVAFAFLFKNL